MFRFKGLLQLTSLLILTLISISATDAPVQVDPTLPAYQKKSGTSGNLNSVGSDTLNNLMTLWSEGFRKQYPSINIGVEGKGSSTAPPALIQGVSQLGPMSRPMKSEEIEAFEKKMGYKPTAIGVAFDALSVYVNKDNPIKALTMPQVDAIFSKTLKGGLENIKTWGQLGLTNKFSAYPISLYGRNSASGTYGFFKEHALFKGDYKDQVKEQPGSSSVVQAVSEDLYGVGYSGIGYKTSGVRLVPLANAEGQPAVEATPENVLNKTYPLARMLLIYVDKKPNQPLPQAVQEFLTYILSKEGQEVVVKDGYIPLPTAVANKQLSNLK